MLTRSRVRAPPLPPNNNNKPAPALRAGKTRGCCYDAAGADNITCFYAIEGQKTTTVHMINSNHFDAGYADLTAGVVNEYFTTYFPRAARVGADLRKATGQPLKWMTFSYMVALYMDCPPGYGLECPSPAAVANFTAAVKARDIVWPALPTNAELAAADAASPYTRRKITPRSGTLFDFDSSPTRSHVLRARMGAWRIVRADA